MERSPGVILGPVGAPKLPAFTVLTKSSVLAAANGIILQNMVDKKRMVSFPDVL
jgi:hypothetical protein